VGIPLITTTLPFDRDLSLMIAASLSNRREFIVASVVQTLRQRREELGMSLQALAKRSGISPTMISFLERDLRNPSLDTLLRLADALELELWKTLRAACEQLENARSQRMV
jgi:DNA-binding XRE family transcriptional regulator